MIQVVRWLKSPTVAVAIASGMLFWLAAGGVRQHPDYLAYFNEFASGHPEDILADSDLDWGQELKRVGRRLQQVGAKESLPLCGRERYATPEYLQKLAGFPPVRPFQMIEPGEGWNVVSPTMAGIFQGGVRHEVPGGKRQEGLFGQANPPWFYTLAPTERVGALLLYHIPPGFRMQ